jgi:hypothetical protein
MLFSSAIIRPRVRRRRDRAPRQAPHRVAPLPYSQHPDQRGVGGRFARQARRREQPVVFVQLCDRAA